MEPLLKNLEKLCSRCNKNKACKYRQLCNTCRTQDYRAKDPVRYVWANLRSNAKRRGKYFNLPLDWFREFVKQECYMEGRGRTATDLSFDRKEADKGYIPGNIRVITVAENSRRVHELNRLHPPYQEIDVPF